MTFHRWPRLLPICLPLASALAVTPARAEVKAAGPDGFNIEHRAQLPFPPAQVYAALGQIGRWWNDAHTFSGKARNLSLPLQAGGCFCERWRDGSVEHGRVLYARNGQVLRLQSALGPLQDMALTGILAFTLEPPGGEAKETKDPRAPDPDKAAAREPPKEASGTVLLLTYRVHGPAGQGLDKLAPVVDGVLGDQFARLGRFLQTGKP
jgi:uncharacterized protein YndB with AHSA1/START domain